MKILVTGGSGMLGSAILRLFHQQYELHFVARNPEIARKLQQDFRVTAHLFDLRDREATIQACKGMDAIIHCAALSSPWGTYQEFYQANVQATQHVVDAAQIEQVAQLVHISTTSLYFDHTDRWAIKEDEKLATIWCNNYAKTKFLAEQVVQESQVKSVILRPRGIFGPNDRAIIPRLLNAVNGQHLFLPSSRNPVVDLTYVDNVAHAAMLACEKSDSLSHGDIFNITNNEPMPIEAILHSLFVALNRPVSIHRLPYPLIQSMLAVNEWFRHRLPSHPEPKLTSYSAGLFHYHQTLDISKAKRILGYQPLISIEQGIEQYAKWPSV